MYNSRQILALDIGASGVRVLELACGRGNGQTRICRGGQMAYAESLTPENRCQQISAAIAALLADGDYRSREAVVCLSAEAVFLRTSQLPPIDLEGERLTRIVQYEARQNIPFPLETVTWDSAAWEDDSDSCQVLFAAVRREILDAVLAAAAANGITISALDTAPTALFNLQRARAGDSTEAQVWLHIGSRSSVLVLSEGNSRRFRTLPIGGDMITHSIARSLGLSFREAEALKCRHGFVALGTIWQEPESTAAATVGNCCRQGMNRLQAQVARSLADWRFEGHALPPAGLFITGGGSRLPFAAEFLQETLRLPVSPLHLLGTQDGQCLLPEAMAHTMGKCLALALSLHATPVMAINLLPKQVRKDRKAARRLRPLAAAAVVWLFLLGTMVVASHERVADCRARIATEQGLARQLEQVVQAVERAQRTTRDTQSQAEQIQAVFDRRLAIQEILTAIDHATPNGITLTRIAPIIGPAAPVTPPQTATVFHRPTAPPPIQLAILAMVISGEAVCRPGDEMFSESVRDELGLTADENRMDQDVTHLAGYFRRALRRQPPFSDSDAVEFTRFSLDRTMDQHATFEIRLPLRVPLGASW